MHAKLGHPARRLIGVAFAALAACGGGSDPAPAVPPGNPQLPVATLVAPAAFASNLNGALTVTANATDDIAVTSIEVQVDGQPVGSIGSGASHSVVVDTNAYASGQHLLRARASDGAGNVSDWATRTVSFGGGRAMPGGFTRNESYVTGLTNATAFAQTPDGRLLVAEQGGALRVLKAGVLLAQPMLSLAVDSSGERGLIGVAVHPNFATNGFIYVYHTTVSNGAHNRITRFTAVGDTAATPLVIADLPNLSGATNHNGGALQFGGDGKLYVGVGDNANGALAPDVASVFGKMLRFNDDGTIPADNPFCTTAGVLRCAVWARGLRNPFTFAIQPGTGRMHINDVGEGSWEEINLGVAGADYGWPATEGPTTASGITAPLHAFGHTATSPPGSGAGGFFTGCAIVGGAFYPNTGSFPAPYRGSYFFGDLCSSFIARVDATNGNAVYAFGSVSGAPVGMLVGLDGALYVLTTGGIVRFSAP